MSILVNEEIVDGYPYQEQSDVDDILKDFILTESSDVEDEVDEVQTTPTKPVQPETFVSPGGTKYWIPIVDESVKIGLGSEFTTCDLADIAYMKYAEEAGFDVRQSSKKKNKHDQVTTRYLLCSKEGKPSQRDIERMARSSCLKRVGCKACVKIRYRTETNTYVVYKFEERHNHALYRADEKGMARSSRRLQYTDFRNVYNAASACIGGAKSYNIQASLKGGYENVPATQVDYQNARTAMGTFVGTKDAQMLVELLRKRSSVAPEYFHDVLVSEGELQAIFWADEIAKLNYKEFGDTISFDATYRTNRHAMNFVPFIAIDNHKRSVVVGSALISHENIVNFKWVLSAFLKAHGTQPTFVITDQCPAMKQAIPEIFTQSIHRLCMWHITKKVPAKFTGDNESNLSFKRAFNKLVWSTHIRVDDFEIQWSKLIEEYGLDGNEWLKSMYAIRQSWIPAYHRDVPMSGLMRTTSRSESSHAFFRMFASYRNDLVKFLHAFDGAIEKQRNKHRVLEFITRHTFPRCATPTLIERHASEVYTRTVFKEVQKEIKKALFQGGGHFIGTKDDIDTYKVSQKNRHAVTKYSYQVVHNTKNNNIECECKFFERNGYPCRHMFQVLLNGDFASIPDVLIRRRWTRSLIPVEIQAARARYGEVDIEKEQLIHGMYSLLDLLVSRTRNEKAKMRLITETLIKLKSELKVDEILPSAAKDRQEALKECYGVDLPKDDSILPPAGIRNKGSGTGKRLVGAIEKATKESSKPKRKCRKCNQMANHDSRNCSNVPL